MQIFFTFLSILFFLVSCQKKDNCSIPYSDSVYPGGPQKIPGKIECEYFDMGGEGIAYHENDSINNGSGRLNKGTNYLNTFRIHEAVDISYTKFHDAIDNSIYNFVEPKADQFYIGWTEPGEWTKYTVDIQTSGRYRVGIMYTANANGQIALAVNDINLTGPIDLLSTYVEADSISWRQWHHWNYLDNIAQVQLKEGVQTHTLHTVTNGQMNYDFLEFTFIKNSN